MPPSNRLSAGLVFHLVFSMLVWYTLTWDTNSITRTCYAPRRQRLCFFEAALEWPAVTVRALVARRVARPERSSEDAGVKKV